jgi:hypothetical protein
MQMEEFPLANEKKNLLELLQSVQIKPPFIGEKRYGRPFGNRNGKSHLKIYEEYMQYKNKKKDPWTTKLTWEDVPISAGLGEWMNEVCNRTAATGCAVVFHSPTGCKLIDPFKTVNVQETPRAPSVEELQDSVDKHYPNYKHVKDGLYFTKQDSWYKLSDYNRETDKMLTKHRSGKVSELAFKRYITEPYHDNKLKGRINYE